MTSVIGILLFIVIMMVVNGINSAISVTTSPKDDPGTIATLSELQRREAVALAALRDIESQIDDRRQAHSMDDLAAKRAELARAYGKVADLEASLRRKFEAAKSEAEASGQAAESFLSIASAEAEVERLRGQLERVRLNRGLTYIAHQDFAKQPILIEVAQDAWRMADAPNSATAISIRTVPVENRAGLLSAILKQYAASSHYVLFIIKPSGVPGLEHAEKVVQELDFAVGYDLLPEEWTAIVASDGGVP
jgi:hypothetical protein